MVCNKCGKTLADYETHFKKMCQACYKYFHAGGTENPIPDPGRIEYDHRGFVVCHICGRAYKRLGSHVRESHKMNIAEYKELFGLCSSAKTTEGSYSEMMRKSAYKNEMPERLIKAGYNTRIKPGETDKRKGKKARLQECINKMSRQPRKVILREF